MYRYASEVVRLDILGDYVQVRADELSEVTGQATLVHGAWGAGVVSLRLSVDGIAFYGLASAVTLNADGITAVTTIKGAMFARLEVTTVTATAASMVRVSLGGWTPNTAFGNASIVDASNKCSACNTPASSNGTPQPSVAIPTSARFGG